MFYRKSEGRRTNPINRGGSRYRGVTHHARTNRYESHIWDDGRQVYLGGFYNEEQAALAYDLAAVNFRGKDAVTNFPAELYHEEAAASGGGQISREAVVSVLREQSKTMNKVDSGSSATVNMEPWEVQLTGKQGLSLPLPCWINNVGCL